MTVNIARKFLGRVIVGPIVGIARGLLGLISFDGFMRGIFYAAVVLYTPAGAGLWGIICSCLALNGLYSLFKKLITNPQGLAEDFKNILSVMGAFFNSLVVNPIVTILVSLLLASVILLFLPLLIGLLALCYIPVAYIISLASESVLTVFAIGYGISLAASFLVDAIQIFYAGLKTIFDIGAFESSEYDKTPVVSGFHAGLAAADYVAGDNGYGTGYVNITQRELVATIWGSLFDETIRFSRNGEVIRQPLPAPH